MIKPRRNTSDVCQYKKHFCDELEQNNGILWSEIKIHPHHVMPHTTPLSFFNEYQQGVWKI